MCCCCRHRRHWSCCCCCCCCRYDKFVPILSICSANNIFAARQQNVGKSYNSTRFLCETGCHFLLFSSNNSICNSIFLASHSVTDTPFVLFMGNYIGCWKISNDETDHQTVEKPHTHAPISNINVFLMFRLTNVYIKS